jgi:hypothetical protein
MMPGVHQILNRPALFLAGNSPGSNDTSHVQQEQGFSLASESRMAVLTQQLPMEGGARAAMSSRLTSGCGCGLGVLLVASPAWVV